MEQENVPLTKRTMHLELPSSLDRSTTGESRTASKSLIPQSIRRSSRAGRGTTTKYKDFEVYSLAFVTASMDAISKLQFREGIDYHNAFVADFANDILFLSQALKQEDANEWFTAMKKEIRQLENHKTWSLVSYDKIPANATILDSIWALKRNRKPDSSLLKYKARLCVRGDQQVHGMSFWDVYAPVVAWALVRVLLILSIIFKYRTQHVDFVNAFAQSKLEETIYLRPPSGFGSSTKGKLLKLHKSLYGLRQAAKEWYKNISNALKRLGFKVSSTDACLFLKENIAVVIYVDDMLLFTNDLKLADELISSLSTDFPLTNEGSAASYLGISITKHEDGALELKQKGSIDKVLRQMKIRENARPCNTPAVKDGRPRKIEKRHNFDWDYASVVGTLLWISSNTRPDIAFAVASATRHMSSPNVEHYRAVHRIGRYLLGTREKGLILRPIAERPIFEIFVDADFAGNYSPNDPDLSTDPCTVRSRTGYILFYAGSPLLWVSKLQGEVALSTTESEYIALSHSLRDALPIQRVLRDLAGIFGFSEPDLVMRCNLYEDNEGAVALASDPKYRLRTKHIAVKYHHFRERVLIGEVKVLKISTHLQKADILTKALEYVVFHRLRALILGW